MWWSSDDGCSFTGSSVARRSNDDVCLTLRVDAWRPHMEQSVTMRVQTRSGGWRRVSRWWVSMLRSDWFDVWWRRSWSIWDFISDLTINFTDNTITVSHGVGLWSRAALSRRRGNGGGDGGELWNCLCRLWPYNLEVLLHFPRISGILCVKCEHGNVICPLLLVWLGVKCGFITSRKGFGHSYVSSFMCGNYISGSLTDKSRDIWLHKTHAFT